MWRITTRNHISQAERVERTTRTAAGQKITQPSAQRATQPKLSILQARRGQSSATSCGGWGRGDASRFWGRRRIQCTSWVSLSHNFHDIMPNYEYYTELYIDIHACLSVTSQKLPISFMSTHTYARIHTHKHTYTHTHTHTHTHTNTDNTQPTT